MKKNYRFLTAVLVCAAAMFSSCSDDDDVIKPESEPGKEISIDTTADNKWVYVNLADGSSKSEIIDPVSGSYNGDAEILIAGKNMGDIKGLNLNISRVSDDSVKIIANDVKFGEMELKELITGAKVEVDSINGALGYKLVGGESICEAAGMKLTTSCEGSVIGKNINININFKPGKMPMSVTAAYKGLIEKGTIDESSFDWDIAFHRWDVKTNNGSALETNETELKNIKGIPAGNFIKDVESEIIVDRRTMMQNKVGYATDYVNKELSKWMKVDLSTMPPHYAASGKVYVLKTAAGKCILIKFIDYTNDKGDKPFITFRYVTPEK